MGPLEFMVIRFEGNRFSGEILPELNAVRERGIVRLLDLVFVHKDMDGNRETVELSDLSQDELQKIRPDEEELGWFAQDDVDAVADQLPENSSAAMILFEHTWAEKLSGAIRRAQGEVLVDGRVPRDMAEEVAADLAPKRRAA